MRIEGVELSDFRNFATLSLTPASSLNVLTGPNAQGKTNLLEGLAVLLVGRSFRGARPADLCRWEAEGARLTGRLRRLDTVAVLRRSVTRRQDGAWAVGGEGCAWARVIPFGWQDLGVLTGGPPARRGFLDGFAGKLYPAHLTALGRYRQVLARRNHLLQTGGGLPGLASRMEPWNAQLARLAVEIAGRRRAAAAAIGREVAQVYPELAGSGHVELEYRSALGPEVGEAGILRALEARLPEEARRGQTLVGPHRDDVAIALDGRELRTFGSRGQQRLMALALRLAETGPVEAAVGSPPVLLLDDALSELDPGARARVLRRIGRSGQVFLTTAEPALPEAGPAAWWEVKGGRVADLRLEAVRGAA